MREMIMKRNSPELNFMNIGDYRYVSFLDDFLPVINFNPPQTIFFTKDERDKLRAMSPNNRVETLVGIVNTLIDNGLPITKDLCEDYKGIHPGLAAILKQSNSSNTDSHLSVPHAPVITNTMPIPEQIPEEAPAKKTKTSHHATGSVSGRPQKKKYLSAEETVIVNTSNPDNVTFVSNSQVPHQVGIFAPNRGLAQLEINVNEDLAKVGFRLSPLQNSQDLESFQNNRQAILKILLCYKVLQKRHKPNGHMIDFTHCILAKSPKNLSRNKSNVRFHENLSESSSILSSMAHNKFCLIVLPLMEGTRKLLPINFEFYDFTQSIQTVGQLLEHGDLIYNTDNNSTVTWENFNAIFNLRPNTGW